MDVATMELATRAGGVEGIAFGEEVFDGAGAGLVESVHAAESAIAGAEADGLAGEPAFAGAVEFAGVAVLDAHSGPVIWQVEEGAGDEHGGGEEVDSGDVGVGFADVGAEV